MSAAKNVLLNKLIENQGIDKVALNQITAMFSVESHGKFLDVIHCLKYSKMPGIGFEFGKMLYRRLKMDNMSDYDYITSVPIHQAKKRDRGYNQSDFIGKGLSKESGIKFHPKLIKRNKYTETQTKLSSEQRKSNVADVFIPYNNKINISGLKILIVDDVLTTGSTINSAARVLKDMGAGIVNAAALGSA
jgi:ComF family protein